MVRIPSNPDHRQASHFDPIVSLSFHSDMADNEARVVTFAAPGEHGEMPRNCGGVESLHGPYIFFLLDSGIDWVGAQ